MLIILNNKCNLTKELYTKYLEELEKINTKHELVLCPSSCFLSLKPGNNIALGSQDCSAYEIGSHTGEISATQLKSLNVKYCIVGHSERRIEQKENAEIIAEKIKKLIISGIKPILCIGETIEEKIETKEVEIVEKKLKEVFDRLTEKEKLQTLIAYEPLWSIGTGTIPKEKELIEIFSHLNKIYPQNTLLYGGSVNENTIKDLKKIKNINGYLLGKVSLNPQKISYLLAELK